MPSPRFTPSPFKEPALADIRGGMPIKDVVKKYNLCERTVYYDLQEVKSRINFHYRQALCNSRFD